LPVVQKINDNQFYLNHNFEQEESSEGALFMDGMNRLAPEDDCLIIYGHNMKNGTMFGQLHSYLSEETPQKTPIISFDTLYKNRQYIPFAAFDTSVDPDSDHYFEIRQFLFDEKTFDTFVNELFGNSSYDMTVDVQYGDPLLLLVTCDYTNEDGRFVLALRALREDESPDTVRAKINAQQ
ncbi:MAG: class B sortase, partial [Christensenellales bacterium]|nr:class B sortase [Christensenellales bacterium]